MEIKSILIKDTTKEERIRDNLGGGLVDAFYEPYINGEKELRQLNEEYRSHTGLVR